jgi:hypothetical protein
MPKHPLQNPGKILRVGGTIAKKGVLWKSSFFITFLGETADPERSGRLEKI